ncbi:MAG: hypothetical protein J2P17_20935, partial [Mycobacterium sp.]|nr:hypothetical protein [Mycobacterium sp.]
WTTGAGAGIAGGAAGGGTLASGAVQGVALASGAGPSGPPSPATVANATDTEAIRRRADMSYLSRGRTSH